MKLFKKILIMATVMVIVGGFAAPVYAALPKILPECARGTGIPSLNCFIVLLATVAKWILGISGSLALLYFIYGGFMLLTSRGNQEQVGKGKTILSRAVIGVIIIFGAYTAISFLTKTVLQAPGVKTGEKAIEEALKGPLIEEPKTPTTPSKPPAPSAPTVKKTTCNCELVMPGGSAVQWAGNIENNVKKACADLKGTYTGKTTEGGILSGATKYSCAIPAITQTASDAANCINTQIAIVEAIAQASGTILPVSCTPK